MKDISKYIAHNVWIVLIVVLLLGVGVGYWIGSAGAPMSYQGAHDVMTMGDAMDMAHNRLENETGDSFDTAFLAEMIAHHEGAISMAELALNRAKHQELKDLARSIIIAQTKEIVDMQNWQLQWYGKE